MSEPVKFGMLAWNQYADWPAFRNVAVEADRLGYDDVWTWDHLYPIVGSDDGPMLEGWLSLAAWAEDMDGYYLNAGGPVPEQPTWKTLADMLLAARIYE